MYVYVHVVHVVYAQKHLRDTGASMYALIYQYTKILAKCKS